MVWNPFASRVSTATSSPAITFVLNAGAGTGAAEKAAEQIAARFDAASRRANVVLARDGKAIDKAARDAVKAGAAAVVAGGGDGTVNSIAAHLVGTSIPLGVLPLGTLNHLAKDLGLPLDIDAATDVVLAGLTRAVDVGEVNGHIFLNNSSIGVYPRVLALREEHPARGLRKWIVATWATLAVLRTRPFMAVRVTVDDEPIVRRTPFVFVGNNAYRMEGLRAGSRERMDAGVLALYMMSATGRRGLLKLAGQVLAGRAKDGGDLEELLVAEAEIELRHRRLHVAVDGELIELKGPLAYRVRPGALHVFVPAEGGA